VFNILLFSYDTTTVADANDSSVFALVFIQIIVIELAARLVVVIARTIIILLLVLAVTPGNEMILVP
jgi:hypothetical protein